MTIKNDSIYLERRDDAQNMARFYHLTISKTLFGEISVTRRWGRIGTRGKSLEALTKNAEEATAYLDTLLKTKAKRGYSAPMA